MAFQRKFGIELEAFGVAPITLEHELKKYRINVKTELYTHKVTPHWKITTDGSLEKNELPFELVSPVLKGEPGLQELEKVCFVLSKLGAQTNSYCGLHIHFSLEKISDTVQFWRNVLHNYIVLEKDFDMLMDPSRRGNRNRYCKTLAHRKRLENSLPHCTSLDDFEQALLPPSISPKNSIPRYFKVNISSYWRYKTIEFRHHHGTIKFQEIANWIRLLDRFLTFSKNYVLQKTDIEPFTRTLPRPVYQYFSERPKSQNPSTLSEDFYWINQYRCWLEQMFT